MSIVTVPPVPQVGFINSLKFSSAGDFLVAGVGQEHRYEGPPPQRGEGGAGWWSWLGPAWESGRRRWGCRPSASPLAPCRLGRWWRIREARNSVCIIRLRRVPRPAAAGS